MTAVPQNRKYHTTFGYIKNNNTLHQIQRYNVTLFNFSISNIDITSGTLSVICDTVTDEQIIYTLDLEDDKATLSTDIYNYCVGGTVEMFLSIVWCLYRDVMEIEYDDEPVDPTDERILLLQARVEQLTADLEAAQSSGGSSGNSGGESSTTAPNILTLGDKQYAIEIISVNSGNLYHKIKDLTTNQFLTVAEAGFTTQNGAASFADSNGNTIQYELCIDGQLLTSGTYGANGEYQGINKINGPLQGQESGTVIGLKATITNNNETISTAYTTYTLGGGELVNPDHRKFTCFDVASNAEMEYTLQILYNTNQRVYFIVRNSIGNAVSPSMIGGFSSQRGQALFVYTTNNNSINYELYIDGTVQPAGGIQSQDTLGYLTNNQDLPAGSTVCVKITIADSNDEVLSTAYDSIVIPYTG